MNLNHISRDKLQEVLENHGFGVYEHESADDLRAAVQLELDSGEITEDELEEP